MKSLFNNTLKWKRLIAFAILLFPYFLNSQTDSSAIKRRNRDRLGFMSVNLGAAVPIGDLASKNIKDPNAGLANAGLAVRFGGGCRLHKNFGLIGQIDILSYPIDAQLMADYMARMNPGLSFSVEASSGWGATNFTFGGFGYHPIDKKSRFVFIPKFVFGFAMGTSPQYTITAFETYNGVTNSAAVSQESAGSDMMGCIQIGGGFNFNLNRFMYITINADYFKTTSKASFKDVLVKGSDGSRAITSFDMDIKGVNIITGFGLRF